MKLPFSKKKSKVEKINPAKNHIAMDIGTEVLKTTLFNMTEEGIGIKKVSRIKQQEHAMNKGVITNLNTVLENCRLAIREVTEGLSEEELPKKVVMGIAGEYVQGVSIVVNYEREDNFEEEVSLKEQKKIVDRVHEQIKKTGKEDLANRTGLVNEDIEILHITVTGMEIGGMNVDSLVGFKGKNVKLYFYASFAPKTYVGALYNVAKSLNLELSYIVSQPFAVARAFSGSNNKDFSGIFIDIGGGTTDIAVVEKGNVADTQMFAFGGRVFTKELSRELKLDMRHAESRKLKYTEGGLDPAVSKDIKSKLYPAAKTWMDTVKAVFDMTEDTQSFPTNIYLCGGGALLPEMKQVMIEFPWTKLLPFASVPKVHMFTPDMLRNISDPNNLLANIYDITPVSLALFAYDAMLNKTKQ
jgi:cell division protein FtsA